jgi:hypothetical protein
MSNNSTTGNRCTFNNIISSCSSVHILNDDVLHHLLSFLDFPSVKEFRLVCTHWAQLAIPHLNRRGYFNIAPGYRNNDNADDDTSDSYSYSNLDLKEATSEYSSLKFELGYLLAAHPMQINEVEVWKHVKSLHITVPLTRERILWIHKLISSLCSPNLSQLTLNFSQDDDEHSTSKQIDSDYNLALNNTANVSFPSYLEYPHLKSLTFEGIYTPSTSYFACHLISSCCNLQHLSFIRCTHSGCLQYGSYSFPLFEHLMGVDKNSLRKLESFKWTMQNEDQIDESDLISVDTDTLQEPIYSANHMELIRTLSHIEDFQLSFGKNLKSLLWQVPFARENKPGSFQLLPGILSKSVASSLVKLQFNCAVYLLNRTGSFDSTVIPISFPCFDNLRELSLGNHTASTLSLSDFVDAAPNLKKLVISGPGLQTEKILQKYGRIQMLRMCWQTTIHSNLNQQHTKLQEFKTDMSIGETSTLHKIFSKFPNLEQIEVGRVSGMSMKDFLESVRSSQLTNLRRLVCACDKALTMRKLSAHVAAIPTLLPNLEYFEGLPLTRPFIAIVGFDFV